ncbi:MAG: glycosyl transferase family 36 [Ignavibacteriales bacterium]|nr:glycosyl transferase family 36 [Ignavibacteriales bacterium]
MPRFETKYGYFEDHGHDYVITNYKTPKPWINVISNGTYGLVISQTGGGFSFLEHSEFNRLNRWHQDLIQDNWGKYFYFKNEKTGEAWNPLWMPGKKEITNYKAIYGFGFASFKSEYKGILVELDVFVPMKNNLEIWNFKVTNKTNEAVELSIYSYFEWCLGSSADHHREFHKTFIETHFDDKLNAMLATKRLWEIPLGDRGHWNVEYPYFGFISSNKQILDYEGDKERFIGQYGDLGNPQSLNQEKLSKTLGKWNDSIGTVRVKVKVESSKTEEAAFYMGIDGDKEALESEKKSIEVAKKYIEASKKNYQEPEQISDALQDVKRFWEDYRQALEVDTPDESVNLLANVWLRYQAIAGRLWARTAYYQQSGAFGFRDQLQDSMIYLYGDHERTENQIRLHARHQFQDGTVLHWWHPISETGLPTKMTDDLLWLPFILFHYLDETNNYSFLNEKEPYYDNAEKKESLFDHSVAAIEKVLTRMSERGLPYIGAGDWNDGLSAVGLEFKGESIWLAHFFYLILKRFSSVCNKTGKNDLKEKYLFEAEKLKEAINEYAWDGEWFWRATKDSGIKIGSDECEEGKIYLNAQTWSVIADSTDEARKKTAMASVEKHLLKNNGTILFYPAYTKTDKYIGYLTRYAPSRRENGGVYTHAATWSIQAFAMMKDAKNAWAAYTRLSPINNYANDPDKYVAEPFVTPGNIDGPGSPNYGMGGWSWYTGSAQWLQKELVEWILGVRPTEEGLVIDPCIPGEWKNYSVRRLFRNVVYQISVVNPNGVSFGVKEIKIDGVKISGNVVLSQNISGKVKVEVLLG